MRRRSVAFRPEAQDDIRNIFEVVFQVSQNRATPQHFVSRILARCRRIGDAPHGGRPRDDLIPGMRFVPFEHSAVITCVASDKVEIVNIFYGGRDYDTFYAGHRSEDEHDED